MTRCMGCMAQMADDERICRYCGYQKGTDVKEAYYLLPGTVLKKKYLIGRVLGYGGFGVTYIGWDHVLQRRVAVKEYLPSDFATRSYGSMRVTVFSGEAAQQFQAGLESFLFEARRLAKFNSVQETVDIYDCFEENGSGYIVMEYLDGVTVKEVLRKRKRISVDQARAIALAVLRGLTAVHKEGIIHRDIAPDNIFLTKTSKVKILDFGAARYATAVQSKSLSVILKPGFAPEEQYRSHGVQGPWTDIYALGATLYCMITGKRPQESIQRLADDHLKPPSELGIPIDPNIENAIMNSLNVRQEYRIQDAESYYRALRGKEDVERIIEKKDQKLSLQLPLWMKCAAAAACVLVCICIGLFATGNLGFSKKEITSADGMAALSGTQRYVPNVSGMSYEQAQKLLGEKNLNLVISGMNYSESIEKNKILSQQPRDGAVAEAEETIRVIMSGGREEIMMPDLSGMTREEAEQLVIRQNLILNADGISEEYSDVVQKGRVITQSVPAEERIAVQTEIKLSISLGSLSEETALLEVPNLTGMTKEKAIRQLGKFKEQYGFTYSLGEVKNKYSTKVEKGRIISQSPKAGETARTNEPISLVISKGSEMVQIPELLYLTKDQAVEKLQKAGLTAGVVTDYSEQAAAGLVIRQDIQTGEKAAKGSRVTITVSLGKAPVQGSTGNRPSGGTGTGGNQPSGGTGNRPSGGSTGSGGQPSTGGSTGAGGQPSTGGSTGSGGQPSTGGSTGSGGQSSSGGAGAGGGNDGNKAIMPDGGSFVVE
ncbi:MAG: PASTA domain-containing protein [Eubacterium sp.]|nr:PASTA domain-containing protein [Eubacterium sp.]